VQAPQTSRPREDRSKEEGPARLEALLCDLGAQVRRGDAPRCEPSGVHATGLSELDTLLGGGFPVGRICEISGPASSGRTSLALSLLAEATDSRGELAALVDPADAFDPPSAEAAGVDLDRLLWVRAGALQPALRCVEQLMQTGGLPLVLLDLGPASSPPPASPHPARRRVAAPRARPARASSPPALHHWIRLARLADRTHTTLVVLSRERMTGSQAALALEARALRADFGAPPHLLVEIEAEVTLVRSRGAPNDRAVPLRLDPGGLGPEWHAAVAPAP
jgi:hypothetical protein